MGTGFEGMDDDSVRETTLANLPVSTEESRLLCTHCLLNSQKDVVYCRGMLMDAKSPEKFLDSVRRQDFARINGLVNHQFDVNSTVEEIGVRNTIISHIARCGFEESFRILVDLGADMTLANEQGVTPMHYACAKGHLNILKMCASHFRAVFKQIMVLEDKYHGSTPVMWAAERGHTECVKFVQQILGREHLLRHDTYRRTATHYAALRGCVPLLNFLIKNKSSTLDLEDKECLYPIDLARKNGHSSAVKVLEDHCPHPYLEEDIFCGVCKVEKSDFTPGKEYLYMK